MPLNYEEYASKVKCRENLELELDEMNNGVELHLPKIAECLVDTHLLTSALKLRCIYFKDIEKKFPNNPMYQRLVQNRRRMTHSTLIKK